MRQTLLMKSNKNNVLLLFIILIAFFLRFYQLGLNPPSLTWDEVAWGYNAYALGIDGKDEFGKFLPYQYLESFGDFKPPVYAYLDILPIKIFGLNEFAVRFPSAFFGTLTVLATYLLVKRIFEKNTLALICAFLLAISPWHINISRAAFEANIASFFIVMGVWLFLESMREKKWYIIFSVIVFCLSLYTFNSARIVSPLLVLVLGIGFWKKLLERKKQIICATIVGIILVAPIAKFLLSPQANLRFQEVNIFSDNAIIERTNQEIKNDTDVWWSKLIHNRRVTFGIEFMKHYFDNFSPDFLFIKGDGNPKFSTQDVGEMYLWELPFFISGIFILFRKREHYWWIVPVWLLLSIIPAATARETPHALRIESSLPTFQIFTSIGLTTFLFWVKRKEEILQSLIIGSVFLLSFLNFVYYFHGYHSHYKREFSSEWQYGYKPAIAYVKSVEDSYDQIYITENLGRPYIYVLFYTMYDPRRFRDEAIIEREALGFVHVRRFAKYRFLTDIHIEGLKKKILYIDSPAKMPEGATVLQTVHRLDGSNALIAYTF